MRIGTFWVYATLSVLVTCLGSWIFVHASGYFDTYIKDPTTAVSRESNGFELIARDFQCILAAIMYIVYYVRKRARQMMHFETNQ